ncbi:MAG: FecR domain-containing protein [Myxococcota bacterium]
MSEPLEKLGARVARAQDELLQDPSRREAVRERLRSQARPTSRETRSLGWRVWAGGAGVLAAAAATLLILSNRAPDTIHYRVGNAGVSNAIGAPISAAEGRRLAVSFSDDSWFRLAPSARARVDELTPTGAQLRLEQGEATFYVHQREGTRWLVRAGPFLVEVIGTTFGVTWEPEAESFALAVYEGRVQVSGPGIGTRQVGAGDEVEVNLGAGPAPSKPPPEPPTPAAPSAPEATSPAPAPERRTRKPRVPKAGAEAPRQVERTPPAPADPSAVEAPEASPTGTPETEDATPVVEAPAAEAPPTPEEDPPWKDLVERGEYVELLSTSSPTQVRQAIERISQRDLVALAAAARRTSDPRTTEIYLAIRSRFPQTDAAAQAAFMLARIEFHDGSFEDAAGWLETYLQERPKGRFAREASGRLIEAYGKAGDQTRAKAAAQRYLDRYPDGPHAGLARSVAP